ncbi:hypothetical protein E1B28_008964 [Marasmius oreades]|uniref:Uncharacterized protein n=1 Tax=Marasmius oreades TaxID=181124 RepID=A0A9P7RZG3_9AGAR|nr:uncharacterized protein E1B28_008964 [Marasmius oreades]KAG7092621.1 hypothetical protein E1B28_008964 [Marasmius oreades]
MDALGRWKPGQPIKFTVLDLSSARQERVRGQQDQVLLDHEPETRELDEDWLQCVPPMSDPGNSSMEAEKNTNSFDDANEPSVVPIAPSEVERTPTPRLDKGKDRAVKIEEVPDEDLTVVSATPHFTSVTSQDSQKEVGGGSYTIESKSQVAGEKNGVEDDPPLPSLDATALEHEHQLSNPSLSSDIANLISSLSNILVSHPELSEGVKNVVQTAIRGDYWPSQREALHRAAGNVAESLNRVDQEAGDVGKKVAEALERFFQTFAQLAMTGSSVANANHPDDPKVDPQEDPNNTASPNSNIINDEGGNTASDHSQRSHDANPFRASERRHWQWGPWDQPHPHLRAHGFGRFGAFGPWGRRPHAQHHHNHHNHPGRYPPPPPPPPLSGDFMGPFGMHFGNTSEGNVPQSWGSGNGNIPTNVYDDPSLTRPSGPANISDAHSVIDASARQDGIPFPHRSNTLPSRHSHPTVSVNYETRSFTRDGKERGREKGTRRLYKILRSLSDMGFSAREHSELLTRVQELLSSNAAQKDDEIVTTVVNEVLSKPVASTSEVNLPGSWD